MLLSLADRHSATDLPSVGDRVVYAPSATLKGRGVAVGIRTVWRGTVWVLVQLDGADGQIARLRPQSLYRDPQAANGRTGL